MQPTGEKILASLTPVLEEAEYVRIDTEATQRVAAELLTREVPPWNNDLQFLGTPEETAQYYFFIDSINFCFWAPKGKERWSYAVEGKEIQGYYAFARAVKDAFVRDTRLFDAKYVREISREKFFEIFDGKNELLLLPERHDIIKENFAILDERFGGRALHLLEKANRDVDAFVAGLIEEFPTFRDIATWSGADVYFLKRAQIFPSDLSFALPDFELARFHNLDHLTVFADYKLPQILEAFGALVYTPQLRQHIANEALLLAGSREEIEIRAHTICAIERIRGSLERQGRTLTTNHVDWMLWVMAKEGELPRPHHKTLTTFY